MKHLYFVRHGLSVMNKSGIFSGRTETPLNDTGREQALTAGKKLTSLKIDCIVVSPLGRAAQTAEIIAQEIGYPLDRIITSSLLTERDFGPLEGTPYQQHLGDSEGVETIEELIVRAKKALLFLDSLPGENILVVSHGALGRALRHCVDPNIPFRPSAGFSNAEIVQLL